MFKKVCPKRETGIFNNICLSQLVQRHQHNNKTVLCTWHEEQNKRCLSIHNVGIFHLTSNRALTAIWSISFYNHNNLSSAITLTLLPTIECVHKIIWIWIVTRRGKNADRNVNQKKKQKKQALMEGYLTWTDITVARLYSRKGNWSLKLPFFCCCPCNLYRLINEQSTYRWCQSVFSISRM